MSLLIWLAQHFLLVFNSRAANIFYPYRVILVYSSENSKRNRRKSPLHGPIFTRFSSKLFASIGILLTGGVLFLFCAPCNHMQNTCISSHSTIARKGKNHYSFALRAFLRALYCNTIFNKTFPLFCIRKSIIFIVPTDRTRRKALVSGMHCTVSEHGKNCSIVGKSYCRCT